MSFGRRSPPAPRRFATATRPHRLQFARRTGQHDDRRLTADDDSGRGSDRVDHVRSGRNQGLLAVGRTHRLEVHIVEARHQSLDDVGDPRLEAGVEHEFAATELRHRRDRHVVGRRAQPAAGDDEVDAFVGQEPQLRFDVARAVAADRDMRELDPELEEPIGDPGAVAVLHAPGEYLGSGNDDARACAHGVRHYARPRRRRVSGHGTRPRIRVT